MAKAKRRAKPRRTSSAGRPAGGKLGAGRGKAPARASAAAAGKAAAGKATGKPPSKKATVVRAKPAKARKPPEVKRAAKVVGGPRPKDSPNPTKASPATKTKPGFPAFTGPAAGAVAKAPRKPETRVPPPVEIHGEAHRTGGEGGSSERANETTAQGFAPAAPTAGGEGHQNESGSAGLPVPIASFTI